MKSFKTTILLILCASMVSSCSPGGSIPDGSTIDIKPLMGKNFADYELVFGKPIKTSRENSGDGEEIRDYELDNWKAAGITNVSLRAFHGGQMVVETHIDYATSIPGWRSAFKLINVETEGIRELRSGGMDRIDLGGVKVPGLKETGYFRGGSPDGNGYQFIWFLNYKHQGHPQLLITVPYHP